MIQSSEVLWPAEATQEEVGGAPHGVCRSAPPSRRDAGRTRRRAVVAGAGAGIALAAFAGAAVLAGLHVPPTQRTVEPFASAWSPGVFAAMSSELSPKARERVRRGAFA